MKIKIILLTILISFSVNAQMTLDDVNKNRGVETKYGITMDDVRHSWSNYVSPKFSGNSSSSRISTYTGGGGNGSNGVRGLGKHDHCYISTIEPASDRAPGLYLSASGSTTPTNWTMNSYHVNRWVVTCLN